MTFRLTPAPASESLDVAAIELPEDSRLPRRASEGVGDSPRDPPAAVRELCVPKVNAPRTGDERRAWFRWVVGHQHLFLYWIVQADVCRRARRALQAGDLDRSARLLRRATALRWGEIAAMLNCSNLPGEVYQAFLRPEMEAIRADFSARSAQDYLVLEGALTELRQELRREPAPPPRLAAARQAFQRANSSWKEQHIEVAERLQPGMSLAVLEYQRLRGEGLALSFPQYVDRVIQAGETLAVYDRFFGVRRVRMGPEAFAATALAVLGQAHRTLALPREPLQWVLRGDHLLLAVINSLSRRRATPAPA